MHIYVNAIMNHFRALQEWAADKDARLTLDLRSFEVEARWRGRYYTLYPLFQARVEGRAVHQSVLPKEVAGFGGWRPYRLVTHDHSTHKTRFKDYLRSCGLATPDSQPWDAAAPPVGFDHVLKADVGSFGTRLLGPFRAGTSHQDLAATPFEPDSQVFAETFIHGQALKVWFWGERAVFAHAHGFPTVQGDGRSQLGELLQARLQACGMDWATHADRAIVLACLRYQGLEESSVPVDGTQVFIDYRYTQRYEPTQGATATTDNALPDLLVRTGTQVAQMGLALDALLRRSMNLPIFVTVDGMLDREDRIHWLEMNTNSILPPEAYEAMFADLFQ